MEEYNNLHILAEILVYDEIRSYEEFKDEETKLQSICNALGLKTS